MQEELVVLKGVTESMDGIRETQLRRTYSLVTKHSFRVTVERIG